MAEYGQFEPLIEGLFLSDLVRKSSICRRDFQPVSFQIFSPIDIRANPISKQCYHDIEELQKYPKRYNYRPT
jgi:hypothetical protein